MGLCTPERNQSAKMDFRVGVCFLYTRSLLSSPNSGLQFDGTSACT